MNLSQLLYRFYWGILKVFSPDSRPEMCVWGIKKHVFLENTRTYKNLQTNLMGFKLKSPVGIASDIGFDEQTIDTLISHGAGFGTLGSYTYRENTNHNQSLFYRRGKRTRFLRQDFLHYNLLKKDKQLNQRRHLPNCVGISMSSYVAEDIRINEKEFAPGYLSEYQLSVQKIAPLCDYLVINASHPSSPMYPLLADESTMIPLIETVQHAAQIAAPISTPKIVLKVPFEIAAVDIKMIAQIVLKTGINGIMISGHSVLSKTTTYIDKKQLIDLDASSLFAGTLLHDGMIRNIREFRKRTNGLVPLIVSDSVMSGHDAYDFIAAGASAVEIGSVFYFYGPTAIHKINAELSALLRKKGIQRVDDLIGINNPLDPNVTIEDLFK